MGIEIELTEREADRAIDYGREHPNASWLECAQHARGSKPIRYGRVDRSVPIVQRPANDEPTPALDEVMDFSRRHPDSSFEEAVSFVEKKYARRRYSADEADGGPEETPRPNYDMNGGNIAEFDLERLSCTVARVLVYAGDSGLSPHEIEMELLSRADLNVQRADVLAALQLAVARGAAREDRGRFFTVNIRTVLPSGGYPLRSPSPADKVPTSRVRPS